MVFLEDQALIAQDRSFFHTQLTSSFPSKSSNSSIIFQNLKMSKRKRTFDEIENLSAEALKAKCESLMVRVETLESKLERAEKKSTQWEKRARENGAAIKCDLCGKTYSGQRSYR